MNLVLGSSSSFSATLNGFHNSVSVASGFYTNGSSSNPSSPPFEFLQLQSTNFPIFGVSFLNQNLIQNGNYNQIEVSVDASGTYRKIGSAVKLQGSGGGFRGQVVPYRTTSPFTLPFAVRDPVLGAVDVTYIAPSPADNYVQVTYIPNSEYKLYYLMVSFPDGSQRVDIPAYAFLSPNVVPPTNADPPGWLQPRPDWDIQVRTIDQDGRGRVFYTTVGNTVLDDSDKVRNSDVRSSELITALPFEGIVPSYPTNAPALTSASLWILMIKSSL